MEPWMIGVPVLVLFGFLVKWLLTDNDDGGVKYFPESYVERNLND